MRRLGGRTQEDRSVNFCRNCGPVFETRRRVAAPVKSTPANDARKPAIVTTKPTPPPGTEARSSAIVTARRPGKRYVDVPEVTEEEHRRVGDLADAMMREMKRVIAEKDRD